jgi:hypothetical protein
MRVWLLAALCSAALLSLCCGTTLAADPRPTAKPDDPKILEAEIRQQSAAIKRLTEILEAEAKGKDIRTEAEKARDRKFIERFSTEEKIAAAVREAARTLNRRADILASQETGRDIRTPAEKAQQTVREQQAATQKGKLAAIDANPTLTTLYQEMTAARTLLAQQMQAGLLGGGTASKELEATAKRIDVQINKSAEYQAAFVHWSQFAAAAQEEWPADPLVRPSSSLDMIEIRLGAAAQR